MSIVEFLTLVTRRQLIFRQFKGLETNDRAEGKIPDGFWEAFARDLASSEVARTEIVEIQRQADTRLNQLRCFRYVSCWTMAPSENALLWQVFAPGGVAVRTTVGKLRAARLASAAAAIRIESTGMVYADDWSELEARGFQHYGVVPTKLFLHTKRTLFAGENEVRFYVDHPALFEPEKYAALVANPDKAPSWYAVEFAKLMWVEEIVADSSLRPWAARTLAEFIRPHRLKFRQSGR